MQRHLNKHYTLHVGDTVMDEAFCPAVGPQTLRGSLHRKTDRILSLFHLLKKEEFSPIY